MVVRSTMLGLTVVLVCGCSSAGAAAAPRAGEAAAEPVPPVAGELPPGAEMALLPTDPGAAPDLTVEVGCSETDLRVVVATVSWKADAKRAEAQRLDVTVFKEGFERGWFATVPVARGGKLEPAPGLRRMDRPLRALELVAAPPRAERKEEAVVEVRNLEPGALYRFRVTSRGANGWAPSPVVEAQAPVCVADEAKEY